MQIKRFDIIEPPRTRLSRCIIHGNTVYVAGLTASDPKLDIKGQTTQVLDKIDHYLEMAGTNKSKLLHVQVWIKNVADFSAMNLVYNDWVDPKNPPVRACVRADLVSPDLLVEIMATAAL